MSLITVMVLIGILQGYNLIDLLLMAVGLVVSAIPEGLPLAITLCLVIGIQKMAEKKALVKKMPAVETLGSTNVICTDKTGTLTCNQMTLVKFAQGDDVFTVTGSGYEPVGHINGKGDFSKMALISSLVHETSLIKEEKGWVCHGDPTEGALITFARKLGMDFSQYHTKIVIPFESENRYMAAFAEDHQHKYLLIKGALDKVVHFCDKMLDQQGNVRPLDVKLLEAHQKAFSSEALRTLALCYIPLDKAYDGQKLQGGTFVALAGIEDPLRPDLEKMASACKTAGISIKMITGDHPHTARAIYHKLMGGSDYKILSGEQIDALTNDEKLETLPNVDIFARVSPQNKLDIVEALKAKKMIVAMTGDGVNDAPSLKGAHIGVAMGTGSDVAKEASSMILLDDNFASLVKAVEMGRMIFLTLQNLITYLLTTAASGVLTICFAIFLKFPLPILPIQFLWINLVTDGSSTLPMCFERLRPYLMLQKPKGQNEPLIGKTKAFYMAIISSYMMIGTLVAFYLSHFVKKHPLIYSQTIAFTTLALFQIWNVQNSRSFDEPILLSFSHKEKRLPRLPLKNNYPLLGTMLLALLLQIGSVFLTSLHPFLGTTHLELNHFGMIIGLTFSCVIVADFFKWMRFKKS